MVVVQLVLKQLYVVVHCLIQCLVIGVQCLILCLDVVSNHIIKSETIVIVGIVESSVGSQRSSGVPSTASLSYGGSSMKDSLLNRAYCKRMPFHMHTLLFASQLIIVSPGIPQDPGLSFDYSASLNHVL